MSAQTIRSLVDELLNATPFDVVAGEVLTIRPPSPDIGTIQFGDGINNFDVKINLSSAAYVLFDVGNVAFTLVGVSLDLADDITIGGNATVTGNFSVTGNTTMVGNTTIEGNTFMEGTTSIGGNTLIVSSVTRVQGLMSVSTRYELQWIAGAKGKPAINADVQDASTAVRMIADSAFEIVGTNAVSSTTALSTGGGVVVTTTAGADDQVIITPHLDTSQTSWAATQWATSKSVFWECLITTGAAITAEIIWAGLKLTNTSTTATDDDQVFFRYQNGVNGGKWEAIVSIAGTDVVTDSAIVVAVATAYHLKVVVDSLRIARLYINSVVVYTSTPLTSTNLIPYIGIQSTDTSTASYIVNGQAISREY